MTNDSSDAGEEDDNFFDPNYHFSQDR